MESNDPAEEYSNWKNKENSFLTKISRKINPIHIVLFFGLLYIGSTLVAFGTINKTGFIIILAMVVVLIVLLMTKEPPTPKLLPEQVIKQIVMEKFEIKRKEGIELPFDAQVRVTLLSGAGYETDVISGTSGVVKREVGVEIIRAGGGYKKSYVVSVHPYDGTILDIIPKPLGINNKDALGKDRLVIPVNLMEKKF